MRRSSDSWCSRRDSCLRALNKWKQTPALVRPARPLRCRAEALLTHCGTRVLFMIVTIILHWGYFRRTEQNRTVSVPRPRRIGAGPDECRGMRVPLHGLGRCVYTETTDGVFLSLPHQSASSCMNPRALPHILLSISLDLEVRVVARFLGPAAVDHECHIIDRNRGFGDVGRKHDLPLPLAQTRDEGRGAARGASPTLFPFFNL